MRKGGAGTSSSPTGRVRACASFVVAARPPDHLRRRCKLRRSYPRARPGLARDPDQPPAARRQSLRPPAERHVRTQGRPAQKGAPLPKLATRLTDPTTRWQRITAPVWYGSRPRNPSRSPVGRPCGIVAERRRGRSAGCWSGTPPEPGSRGPSSAPTPRLHPQRSLRPSCAAGRLRSPSPRCGPISASRPSGNGRTKRSPAPRRPS